jgi:8-oxo-dGTP pyrophosphatase MutT (NUDIX family)
MWDISVTGHLSTGQDSLTAATREISEEVSVSLGYSVEVRDFRFMFSYRKEEKVNENHFDRQYYDFFILRQNGLTTDNI